MLKMLPSRRRIAILDPVSAIHLRMIVQCGFAANGFWSNAQEIRAFTAEFDFPLKKSDNFPRASKNQAPKMFPKKTDTAIANEATFTLVHWRRTKIGVNDRIRWKSLYMNP